MKLSTHELKTANRLHEKYMEELCRGAKYRVRCKVGTRRRCFTVATLAAAQKLHRKLELQQWGEFACIRK